MKGGKKNLSKKGALQDSLPSSTSDLKSSRKEASVVKTLNSPHHAFGALSAAQRLWLQKLEIQERRDLLFYLPRRHEDRTREISLDETAMGHSLVVRGVVQSSKSSWWRGGRGVFEAAILLNPEKISEPLTADLLKKRLLRCRWYGMPFLKKSLVQGRELILYGKLFKDKQGLLMTHPEFELMDSLEDSAIHLNRLTPIYPLVDGVPQRGLRRLIYREIMERVAEDREVEEFYPVPEDLISLKEAIPNAHFPENGSVLKASMRRLVYDEFFILQCVLAQRREGRKKIMKARGEKKFELGKEFLKQLPFEPTNAQKRVIREIERDLENSIPMHRLVQGDVGSGKTLIAIYAMVLAVERGEHAALMAPTEILAEQHFMNLKRWLEPLGVSVGLHTSAKKKSDRSPMDTPEIQQTLFKGKGMVTVGTHALLYDSFVTEQLGLVVIDEQHKFGVMQRLTLVQKGKNPDVLVMTATPIPRTLGMTLYGDLEVSVIDELPPGRSPIRTACRTEQELSKVWAFMRKLIEEGRQAYVVYPLIDESEKIEAKAVQTEFEKITKLMAPHAVGLLHGRLKADEKEAVMKEFREGRIKILVSTPVIEVGVDVPNATLMVIENAERFGLAQLHQLRGRIGRGAHQSYCALIGEAKSLEGWQRLKVMEETCDGFKIAEKDFQIRGPGNIFGTEQSGLPPLRVGDFLRDFDLLQRARRDAVELLQKDPELKKFPLLKLNLEAIHLQRKTVATVG